MRPALLLAALAVAGTASVVHAKGPYVNVTRGGTLQPGLYGRIVAAPDAPPPPVVNPAPVVAAGGRPAALRDPVYLYVPPGQLRRWAEHCAKWDACERPVYFVRVDDSPSRLGDWKKTQRPSAPPLTFALGMLESR